jgi:tetratricopeptide (TPR) repeat protein
MLLRRCALIGLMVLFAGGCSFGLAGKVQSGRQALLTNNPDAALGYFQQAAAENPQYVYTTALLSQSVLTYLGKTQYLTGKLPEARQTLSRALEYNPRDDMARLYLGLTLARLGETQNGVKDIGAGLKGLHDWVDYTATHRLTLGFWDPNYEIRKSIQNDLQMMSGKDLNLETLIADGEWAGRQIEEEAERVLREEQRHLRDRDYWGPGRGTSVGVGFGF